MLSDRLRQYGRKECRFMLKIFLSSHGRFASGIRSSCEILLGAQQNLTVFDAYVDNDTVQEHLDDFYKTVSAEDQVLLCSYLYGGSVNQSLYPNLQKPNTRLVSGVNMTFMMNVLCEEELSDERLEEILEESRSYLRRVNLETNETEDESFF